MDKLSKKKPSSSEAPSLSSHRFKTLLQSFSSKVSGVVGQEYFEAVVSTISEELAMDFVFIGELIEGKTKSIRTRAVYAKGQLVDNFDYGLEATPCANVMEQNVCIYPMGVQAAFPEDLLLIEMCIEGYMGAPLIDSRGHPMGIMVVLHCDRIENRNSVAACFDIVAGRTSAELERMKKEEQLKEALVVTETANQTKSMFLATIAPIFTSGNFSNISGVIISFIGRSSVFRGFKNSGFYLIIDKRFRRSCCLRLPVAASIACSSF